MCEGDKLVYENFEDQSDMEITSFGDKQRESLNVRGERVSRR